MHNLTVRQKQVTHYFDIFTDTPFQYPIPINKELFNKKYTDFLKMLNN